MINALNLVPACNCTEKNGSGTVHKCQCNNIQLDVEKLNKAFAPVFGMSPYKDDISEITRDNHVDLDDKTLVSVFQWYLTNN
jgi:hypothetical protein